MNHARNRRIGTTPGVGCLAVLLLTCHLAAAAGQPPKPCEFFTRQAAEVIFGAPLDAGHDTVLSCTYSAAGGDDQKGLMVNFIPPSGASEGMNMSETYDNLIHQDPSSTLVPVSGLGDTAHFMTLRNESAIEVLYHNTIVGIMATSSPNPNLKAALIEAVRQMIQKLQ
jgi:hypothetical protein